MEPVARNSRETLEKMRRLQKLRAKRFFYEYCCTKAPSFYKPSRLYLKDFADQLQSFYQSQDEVLIIEAPPRHGKSRTIGCFVEWVLGNDQTQKVITGSYNEILSTTFSKNVRNTIMEEKGDRNKVVFSDIFSGVTIRHGDGAMNLWSLTGGYNNYLATSPTGTATGFGATILIIDDLIKSALEANNADTLEKHWSWFTDTMLSRLEEGGKIIIVMTRWHTDDLAGRAYRHYKKEGKRIRHISYKALQPDGSMLCPEILSRRSYDSRVKLLSPEIAAANYQQEPIDIKGRLYSSFKIYKGKLPQFREIRNYTDTADEGDDVLCSITYGVTMDKEAYILDVLYTKAPMEETEPAAAEMLVAHGVNVADIESNSGGRGYARAVGRHLKEMGSNTTVIRPFHQSKNKRARILTHATWVMEHVYFPENWADKWPEYHDAMIRYQREGKNAHDDAPDATTGIAEKIGQGSRFKFS